MVVFEFARRALLANSQTNDEQSESGESTTRLAVVGRVFGIFSAIAKIATVDERFYCVSSRVQKYDGKLFGNAVYDASLDAQA